MKENPHIILLAGIDGGATKTVAAVGRRDGVLIGVARAGPSNYHNVGIEEASRSVRQALRSACRIGGASTASLETVVMGLAAMDSRKDFAVGRKIAALSGIGKRRVVKHDSVVAVYAATLGKPGIVVNAGTGSFAAGINEDGNVIRAGGWGDIVDDEGSAYDVGRLGIRAALRALDGREKPTVLGRLLMKEFRLRTLEDIVHEVYDKPMSASDVSAICPLVAKAASRGDQVARSIFAHEGRVLAELVTAVAKRMRMTGTKPQIYCVGGVFKAGSVLLGPFRRELHNRIPRFILRRPRFEPVVGAFVLALKEQGITARGRTLGNLTASYLRHVSRI